MWSIDYNFVYSALNATVSKIVGLPKYSLLSVVFVFYVHTLVWIHWQMSLDLQRKPHIPIEEAHSVGSYAKNRNSRSACLSG
jgi:hypothetical protein